MSGEKGRGHLIVINYARSRSFHKRCLRCCVLWCVNCSADEHRERALLNGIPRRGSPFLVRVVKCWNTLPASVVTAPSVNVFKKRLEKVFFIEVFLYFRHWLNTHLPIPLSHPTCTPPVNVQFRIPLQVKLVVSSCWLLILPTSYLCIDPLYTQKHTTLALLSRNLLSPSPAIPAASS